MGRDRETDEEPTEYVRREGILRVLSGGPVEREEVQEVADISGSTAYRLLGSLVERGIAEEIEPASDSDAYTLTPVGEAVLDETERFREAVGRISSMEGIVASARETGIEFDPSLFKHGIVTVSEERKPYAPARRLTNLVGDKGEVRLLAGSTASTVFFGGAGSLASEGTNVDVVCSKEVAKRCVEMASRQEVEKCLTVRVHDDPPLTVALFDERVAVGAHDNKKGSLLVLVDTGSRDAYGWGEEVYERYRERSEEYRDY
jgi:predicted transcriptional regulator